MSSPSLSLLAGLAMALSLPQVAHAEEPEPVSDVEVVARQDLVGLLNPMGAEHRFDLGLRSEIGDQEDILFLRISPIVITHLTHRDRSAATLSSR
jgi:hypothetical protein